MEKEEDVSRKGGAGEETGEEEERGRTENAEDERDRTERDVVLLFALESQPPGRGSEQVQRAAQDASHDLTSERPAVLIGFSESVSRIIGAVARGLEVLPTRYRLLALLDAVRTRDVDVLDAN